MQFSVFEMQRYFFHLHNAGDHGADLRREHLVAVVHQLAPLLHVAGHDRQSRPQG